MLYGGPNELHEVAINKASKFKVVEGDGVKFETKKNVGILQWKTSSTRRVVQSGSLFIYLVGTLPLSLQTYKSNNPKIETRHTTTGYLTCQEKAKTEHSEHPL